ncbi:Response regulator containing a CheY-like receiver domain and an HTH DNA-binding domain [Blastococcus saxobsidens DD2]|uniref:Response regulator containing a CheY-like receiver domain and an HTH DNA-binding domain n=2 Tax=Blastococcus saxobsidens TaxID=138336 RepID=H6RJF9_BLASD|nr:Response regulator containing a CheY-like receiver domain and an HTH DNA-binding domain [Blastococcus saxobsidens DD2]
MRKTEEDPCWPGSPQAMARRVVHEQVAGDGATHVAVLGPGGTGKTTLLAELVRLYRRAGVAVVDAQAAPEPGEVTDRLVVLVDDAHRLTPGAAGRLRVLLRHPLVGIVVAYRPWPRPPALQELIEAMAGDRRLVVLGHLDRDVVRGCAEHHLGPAAAAVVDPVLRQTGGLPALVEPMLRALAAAGAARQGAALAPRGAVPGPVGMAETPGVVSEQICAALADLDPCTRAVLHALAAGAPLDAELLAELVGTADATDLVQRVQTTGALLATGRVVPAIGSALLSTTPHDVTRSVRRRLFTLLLDRGEEPVELARALAADRVREPRVARLLLEQADAALAEDPGLAGALLSEAVDAGAPAAPLAVRRALAAALVGDLDGALQWADPALRDESAPGHRQAAGITAAVLAQRGLLTSTAELYRVAGPQRAGSTALALLAVGAREDAEAELASTEGAAGRWSPHLVSGCESLMARGVLESIRPGPSTAEAATTALSTLTRAATLLEPVGRTALLMDTPSALAALVALHTGELGSAESVLERALAADIGGPPARSRHLLLLAWTAMLRGRMPIAVERMNEARSGRGPLEPRDELFLRALEVGLARRASDLPALLRAWGRAREAVVRHPVDLFTLLPLGELVVAAARLGETARLAPHLAEAEALLARLGNPPLWSTSLHWSGAQAAIVMADPAMLQPHATALVSAARTSFYAAVLADAGRSWLRVLVGDIDAVSVLTAAERLAGIGLTWDGSRLAGQAAARATDSSDRSCLLQCARVLSGDDEPRHVSTGGAAPHGRAQAEPGGVLSAREREIAALVVEGLTYREIGAQLYISAKTVEHHVSRMRQRLGASSRSDLLARLRAELAEGA